LASLAGWTWIPNEKNNPMASEVDDAVSCCNQQLYVFDSFALHLTQSFPQHK
jgi:hypothetical protein